MKKLLLITLLALSGVANAGSCGKDFCPLETPFQKRLKEAEMKCKNIKDAAQHLKCVKDQMKPSGTKTQGIGVKATFDQHKDKLLAQLKK